VVERIRLSRVARTVSGTGFPPSAQGESSGDLPFLKVSDLALPENRSGIVTAANWITTATAAELGARIVPPGSTVFPKVGAALAVNARGFLTVHAVMDNNVMAVVPTDIDSRYLYHVLKRVDMAMLDNGGALPFVSDTDVRALIIPFPSREDQRAMAQRLDAEAEALYLAERRHELELERHSSVIAEVVDEHLRECDVAVPGQLDHATYGQSVAFAQVFTSREEYGCPDYPMLTVTSDRGVAVRDMDAGGRARARTSATTAWSARTTLW